MKKGDIIIIVIVAVVATFLAYSSSFGQKSGFNEIQIVQDGKIVERYAANNSFNKIVNITEGKFSNTIEIKDGQIKIINANCPDQLCVHSRAISKDGEMIVCLPHKLYVKIVSSDQGNIDIIAN